VMESVHRRNPVPQAHIPPTSSSLETQSSPRSLLGTGSSGWRLSNERLGERLLDSLGHGGGQRSRLSI
jgi:hypothetical protein